MEFGLQHRSACKRYLWRSAQHDELRCVELVYPGPDEEKQVYRNDPAELKQINQVEVEQ